MSESFSEKFGISPMRYIMMFSFDNIYGIFRAKGSSQTLNSLDYDLFSYNFHNSNSSKDVLMDLCISQLSGKKGLVVNDVVAIRVNGKLYCYRFIKKVKTLFQINIFDSFAFVPTFLIDEIETYLCRIHNEYKVLSLLDGIIYPVDDVRDYKLFCIENETSVSSGGTMASCFSVFSFADLRIRNNNPGGRPFISLNNAFFFYKKLCNKGFMTLLLYNRFELEMVKDCCELSKITLSLIG